MKWLVMLYVFIALSCEYVYLLLRCMIDKPVVYKDYPERGVCRSCNRNHQEE